MIGTQRIWRYVIKWLIRSAVADIHQREICVWGDPSRLHISKSAMMVNTLFNVSSGDIWIGEQTFAGHNVSIITGTHDYTYIGQERMVHFPRTGNDIRIGNGVWIGSNAVILGPCQVGDNAVIGAASLVRKDVPQGAIVAGVPARVIHTLKVLDSRCEIEASLSEKGHQQWID